MTWTTDITNDPDRDFELCIEIYQADKHRATLARDASNTLVLTVYEAQDRFEVPALWLAELLQSAEKDLPPLGLD